MSGFADRLGDGSIETIEAAAPWRLDDAACLENGGRRCAALYMDGYVIEIRLTAAAYRLAGYALNDAIARDARRELERDARRLSLMSAQPHDFAGWARYVVYLRQSRDRGFARTMRDTIIRHAEGAYEHWRPRLRYRALTPTAAVLRIVRDAAGWFDQHYATLWR